jgi:hypothetical protein
MGLVRHVVQLQEQQGIQVWLEKCMREDNVEE